MTLAWCQVAYAGYYSSYGLYKTGAGDLTLQNTSIHHIAGDALRLDGSSGNHDLRRSVFANSTQGVLVRGATNPITLDGCHVLANASYGILNQTTGDVDARQCWWGDASGPLHPTLNPGGFGNRVSDRVLFDPWLHTDAFGLIVSPRLSGALMQGDTLRFRADPAAAQPGNTSTWSFGDRRTSNLPNPGLVSFPEAGEQTVTFTLASGGVASSPGWRTITVVPAAAAPDLRVTSFTVPGNLALGSLTTLDYTVTNAGDAAIAGRGWWFDSVYLSEDEFLNLRDVPLASVLVSRSLAVGESYSGALRVRINAVREGQSYLILAVDDSWEVLDRHRLNGERAASTSLAVPILPVGTPVGGQFTGVTDATHYYRLDVAAGQSLSLAFTGSVRVYLRFGALPTPAGYAATLRQTAGGYDLTEVTSGFTYQFSAGRLVAVRDANNQTIELLYSGGLLTALRNPYGQTIGLSYNAAGRISGLLDSDGNACTYAYDGGNEFLTAVTDGHGRTTQFAYDPGPSAAAKALIRVTHPDGTAQHFDYDSEGRLASAGVDAAIAVQSFTYGEPGAVTMTDSLANSSRFVFSQYGSILKSEMPQAMTQSFNAVGSLETMRASDGTSATLRHDARGNLTGWTDALGQSRSFAYDARGNLTRFTDPNGRTTASTRDAAGNLQKATYANGQTETFAYDAHGNLAQQTNARGQTTIETANDTGRIGELLVPGSGTYRYSYAANGDLVAAEGPDGVTAIGYDADSRVSQVVYPDGRSLHYTYDGVGRRTPMQDHLGNTTHYLYDAYGRLKRISDTGGQLIVGFAYGPGNQTTRKNLGNGAWTEYAYDAHSRPESVVNHGPDGTVLSRYVYAYDGLGQIRQVTTAEGVWEYTYDLGGQLTQALFTPAAGSGAAAQDITYRYDAFGNRTSATVNGTRADYAVNVVNQYTQAGAATLAYDADGNLNTRTTGADTWTHGYDAVNRLISATHGANTWTFEYDAFAFRSGVTRNGVTTRCLHDPTGLGDLVGEFSADGTLLRRHVHAAGLAASFNAAGNAYYPTFDLGGNVSELTDAAGVPVNAYRRRPFGDVIRAHGTVTTPFGFTGEFGTVADDTGLVFMRNRYYDPELGRFISQDPPRA